MRFIKLPDGSYLNLDVVALITPKGRGADVHTIDGKTLVLNEAAALLRHLDDLTRGGSEVVNWTAPTTPGTPGDRSATS